MGSWAKCRDRREEKLAQRFCIIVTTFVIPRKSRKGYIMFLEKDFPNSYAENKFTKF
jgi:hypothetical protein